jgi:hypothetical protein
MAKTMCPGQDTAFWKPGDIFEVTCSQCGHEVEFFKDDASRRCIRCGSKVANPRLNLGCALWCEHAKDCLGYDPKEGPQAEGEHTTLVDRLVEEVGAKVGQAELEKGLAVLDWAKRLMAEEGGDPKLMLAAALLDGVPPDRATGLLKDVGLDLFTAQEIVELLEAPIEAESLEVRILSDARRLAQGGQTGLEGWLTGQGARLAEAEPR